MSTEAEFSNPRIKMMKKVHYAWFITLGCLIVMFYGLGLGFNCISVFLNPLMESINVSNTLRSSITIFYQSGSVLALLTVGHIIDRIGVRRTIFISGICMAAGYIFLSAAKSVLLCYGAMLVIGIGYGAGAIVPCSLLLTTWFSQKKGFALGIATCGSGIATIFFPSIISNIITEWSVQRAFVIHGMMIAALAIIAFLILRDTPEEKGLKPYGFSQKASEDNQEAPKVKLKQEIKDPKFILMSVAIVLIGMIISPVVTHMSPIVSQSGYSVSVASQAVSAYGIAMILGKPLYGAIIDKVGVLRSNIYIYSFLILSMIAGLMLYGTSIPALAFTILFGIGGAPIIPVGLPIWAAEMFGKNNMGNLFAMLKLCSSLGGTIGAVLPGIIIDRTGSYTDLFIIYIAFIVCAFCIMQYLFIKKKKHSLIVESKT